MRRLLALVLYLAMMAGGASAVVWMLFGATGGRMIVLSGGAFTFLFGAYLLWTDFLSADRQKGAKHGSDGA
jgi:hypothetical protein